MSENEARAHAVLGASSSKRWMNCPGSIKLSEGMPDPESEYAREGTIAHGLGETCLREGHNPHDYVGQTIETDGIEGEVTSEMADAVKVFVDHVGDRAEELLKSVGYDYDAVSMALEDQFDLGPINPPGPMFGTGDVVIWAGNHLEVIDYKHGRGVVVEVEENPQVMYYALGAAVKAGRLPETIRVTIAQPRADHPDGPVRSYDFDRARLIEFKGELFEAAARTLEPAAELKAGSWCKFCRAKAVCPAQKAQAESVAMTVFAEDVEPLELPTPGALTHDQIAAILPVAGDVMDWLREVEAYALAQIEQGHEIPGFKLVEGRSNRRWTNEEGALSYLSRKGLKIDERTDRKIISPAQAEKKLKAKGHDTKYLEKFWEKPEGKKKLAPAEDPRPALPPAVQQAFEGEIEQPTTP